MATPTKPKVTVNKIGDALSAIGFTSSASQIAATAVRKLKKAIKNLGAFIFCPYEGEAPIISPINFKKVI